MVYANDRASCHCGSTRMTECPYLLPGESLEIIDHGGNQLLSAGIFRGKGNGKKIEKIARLLGSFAPIRSRRCKQVSFQLVLPKTQGFLVRLDLSQEAAQISGLLSRHAAMLIQIYGLFGHVRGLSNR
jgi:hypothetical protein